MCSHVLYCTLYILCILCGVNILSLPSSLRESFGVDMKKERDEVRI